MTIFLSIILQLIRAQAIFVIFQTDLLFIIHRLVSLVALSFFSLVIVIISYLIILHYVDVKRLISHYYLLSRAILSIVSLKLLHFALFQIIKAISSTHI